MKGLQRVNATAKLFHYGTTQALCAHVLACVAAYNVAKHLKALRWRTPFQAVCDAWKTGPASFKINPHHLTTGLYILLSHNLGHRVVAEGIETRQVLDIIAGAACDEAQGYFLGRPMIPDDFVLWVQNWVDPRSH